MALTDLEQEELNHLRLMQSNNNRWFSQQEYNRIQELVKKEYE